MQAHVPSDFSTDGSLAPEDPRENPPPPPLAAVAAAGTPNKVMVVAV